MNYITIISVVLLIALNLDLVIPYQDYTVRKLCPKTQLKSAFNQIYNNRPGIQLFNESNSAVFVHDMWYDENIDQFENCVFTIDANLYTADGGRYGRGLFASVKDINFRQDANGKCIDYIRLSFDGARTEKICGKFSAEDEIGQRTFFNEGGGIIKVHIFVNKSISFTPWQRSVELNLLFTAYEQCSFLGQHLIKCIPDNNNFCISSVFKNDKIQNCPPPHAGDETKKNQHHHHNQHQHNSNNRQNEPQVNQGPKNHTKHDILFITAFIALYLSYIL